jgi:hypothetical protein
MILGTGVIGRRNPDMPLLRDASNIQFASGNVRELASSITTKPSNTSPCWEQSLPFARCRCCDILTLDLSTV